MDKHEAEAAARDMSRIYGGRWTTDESTFIDGYPHEIQYAAPESTHLAAIRRLRWNMGSETHDEDCAHIFSAVDGRITPYSLLDLDLDLPRKEAGFLRGTRYEAEADEILSAVLRRHQKFLQEVKKGKLMKRDINLRFKIIDRWDLNAPSARKEKAPRRTKTRGKTLKQGEYTMRNTQTSTARREKTPAGRERILSAALKMSTTLLIGYTPAEPIRHDRQGRLFEEEAGNA
jgi:hypothetical protein